MAETKKTYEPDLETEAVKQAQANLQTQLEQKPGAYTSQWQTQLRDTMDKILNRESFQYDMNSDALYQQYKDQAVTGGKLAMLDTMGQASAMTGGYGNSYAQRAGQQAYQGYLQGLNDKLPELYSLALSRYQTEGDALAQNLNLMQQQESQDYGRYQDSMNAWLTERDYLQGLYDTERSLAASLDEQTWNRALQMYDQGVDTEEIRQILGIPETKAVSYSPGGTNPKNDPLGLLALLEELKSGTITGDTIGSTEKDPETFADWYRTARAYAANGSYDAAAELLTSAAQAGFITEGQKKTALLNLRK